MKTSANALAVCVLVDLYVASSPCMVYVPSVCYDDYALTLSDFPLWHMGISGYEVFVLSVASPLLLAIPSLRSLATRNAHVIQFLSLVGLLAFTVQHPVYRLFTVGLGAALGCLAWSAAFYGDRDNKGRLEARISAFAIGLLTSSVAKYAFKTNNPIWPTMHAANGGWNKLGLFLAILASIRSSRRRSVGGGDYFSHSGKKGSAVLAALGVGGVGLEHHD